MRWLDVLPPERFTLVVTDDSDRDLLPRTFEQLLGLPEGLLEPAQTTNASLSMNAVEVLRRVNQEFVDRGWSDRDYVRLVQQGMVAALQRHTRSAGDAPVPSLPGWARPLVAERSARRVAVIQRLGINVVGDPDQLLLPDGPAADEADLAPDRVSVEAAAAGRQRGPLGSRRPGRAQRAERKPARPHAPPASNLADSPGRDVARSWADVCGPSCRGPVRRG